jgi:hypothetical protein
MGKITQEQKNRYFEKVQEHRKTIEAGIAREKTLLELLKKDEAAPGHKRLHLAEEVLDLVSWYVLINSLSVSLLGIKNDDYLVEGRKTLVRAMKYLEEAVSATLDGPFSDYENLLDEIRDVDAENRFRLVRKFGFAIQSLEEGFGANSKYAASFPELWGKLGALAKNLIDLRSIVTDTAFGSPSRELILAHLGLARSLLSRTADAYREKYQVHTQKLEDFRIALTYLSALRRLAAVVGDRDETEGIKKKMDVWNKMLETDQKRHDEKKK